MPSKIFDIDYLGTILKDFDPYSKTVGNYYNAILQNLFFATLNRAIDDEQGNKRKFATNVKKDIKTLYRYAEMFSISENEVINLFAEVPFLNGGLFECLDKTKKIDGVEQAFITTDLVATINALQTDDTETVLLYPTTCF